jgi:hypothetical protein
MSQGPTGLGGGTLGFAIVGVTVIKASVSASASLRIRLILVFMFPFLAGFIPATSGAPK